MTDPRTVVDTHRNGTIPAMLSTIRTRVADGAVIRLDAKAACPGGPFGDDEAYSRTGPFDPGWCFRDRDRNLPPVLRVGVSCDAAGLGMLFWPDLYGQAQTALRELLTNKPQPGAPWDTRFLWTRTVLTLVSIALEATNVQPLFMFPAPWAQQTPWKGLCGADQRAPGCAGHPGQWIDWGLYSSGYTMDGAADNNGQLPLAERQLCHGGAVPSEVVRMFTSLTAQARVGSVCGGFAGVGSNWGMHYNREQSAPPFQAAWMPARMVGSCIFEGSQLVRSLAEHDHDPWKQRGNSAQGQQLTATGALPNYVWSRLQSESSGRSIAQIYQSSIANMSCETVLQWIFELEPVSVPAATPGHAAPPASPIGTAYLIRGLNADGTTATAYAARFYLEMAAAWAQAIVNRTYIDILAASTLFYLTNHATYFRRIFGDAFGLSLDQQRTLLAATLRMKAQLLSAPAVGVAAALAPVTGGIFSQVAQSVISGVSDLMTTYASYPELPKPLYRRVPTDLTCGFDTSTGGESAANAAAAELQRQLEAQRRAAEAETASPVGAIVAGGVGLGLGLGLVYLVFGRK